jgi:hypothetical protein
VSTVATRSHRAAIPRGIADHTLVAVERSTMNSASA